MRTEVNKVYSTKNYAQFSSLKGNRTVNEIHVARLKESMSKRLLFSPIIVNEYHEIIDGQHRFQACQSLDLPINYIVVKGYGLSEVQILNTNSTNWKKEDYLKGYCDLGYSQYIQFQKFMDMYPDFGISACETMLVKKKGGVGKSASGKEVRRKYFEEGSLQIDNFGKSVRIANMIMQVKPYYEGFNKRNFVAAIVALLPNKDFDFDKFITKLQNNPVSLEDCATVSQYKALIEEVYNYKNRNKVNLRF